MPNEVIRIPRRRSRPDAPVPAPAEEAESHRAALPVAAPEHAAPGMTSVSSGDSQQPSYQNGASPAGIPARLVLGTEGEKTVRPGSLAGDRTMRIVRPRLDGFRVTAPGHIVLEREPEPKGAYGRTMRGVKRALIGAPIASAHQAHERLTKIKALAVFSSDALSSVAYATEAILIALVAGGPNAMQYVLPIGIAITFLLVVVATSYRQTIFGYPGGGGSYIVSKDNLGTIPGLIAGAALLIDYVLTVAVSVSAGVSAITSAFPNLHSYQVQICLAAIALICVLNLRGLRESGTIFAIPTYCFIAIMLGMIALGLIKLVTGNLAPVENSPEALHALRTGSAAIGLFFLLNAFAQGCSAMTGVEAIKKWPTSLAIPGPDARGSCRFVARPRDC